MCALGDGAGDKALLAIPPLPANVCQLRSLFVCEEAQAT